jgi:hypothetical protein
MKRRMSHGQAIRSIFGRSRVTQLPEIVLALRLQQMGGTQ